MKGTAATRTFHGVRPLLLLLFFAASLPADEAADRAAIEATVRALNEAATPQAMAALFTADAEPAEIDALFRRHQALVDLARTPMSEVALPHVGVRAIRFITQEVALADAADTQHGSLGVKRIGILFVLRRDGARWRIAAARLQ